MPAINSFVDQTPVATTNLRSLLLDHVGLKTPSLFQVASKASNRLINSVLDALFAYDNNPTADSLVTLQRLLVAADLVPIRPSEEPDDVVVFYPKRTSGQAFTITAVLGWRFGKVKVNGDPTTYANPVNNFCHIEEHTGQDGTTDVGIAMFLQAKGKFFLINACGPHVAPNPHLGKIKYFSDAAHSISTDFPAFLTNLFQSKFPTMPCVIAHGMDGGAHFKLLMGNDYGRFLSNGAPSFTTLLAISLAQEDVGPIPIVSVESIIPGFIVKNGVHMPMSPTGHATTSALRHPGKVVNTNVDGHIRNFSTAPLWSAGKQTDLAVFTEFDGHFRTADSPLQQKYIDALQRAIDWSLVYDPAIQSLNVVKKRFPDIFEDLSKYGTLFDPVFIAKYKQDHAADYATDSAQFNHHPASTAAQPINFMAAMAATAPATDEPAADDTADDPDLTDPNIVTAGPTLTA